MFHFWATGRNPDAGGYPSAPISGSWSLGNNDSPYFVTDGGKTGLFFTTHLGGYSYIDTVEWNNSNPNSSYWTAGRTMEAWVKIDVSTNIANYGHMNIVAMGNIGLGNAMGIRRTDVTGQYLLSAWNVSEKYSSTIMTPGNWYHIAVEINGSTVKGYINGVLDINVNDFAAADYSTVLPAGSSKYNDLSVNLGRKADDTDGFRGLIDSVRISRGIRYGSSFTPATTLTEDSDTWFLAQLNNNYTIDGFIS